MANFIPDLISGERKSQAIQEAMRYLGAASEPMDSPLGCQVSDIFTALSASIQPRFVYKIYQLDFQKNQDQDKNQDQILLLGTQVVLTGTTANRMLKQCHQAALLACTLGAAFDLRLLALQARDMARAAIWDACGSALVEFGCDLAEQEIAARFPDIFLTDRFSPGYGDLPLTLQPNICTELDTGRRLGLHVSKSLLMNPVKSVTAVIGLASQPQIARIRGCAYCQLQETCTIRAPRLSCSLCLS